MVIYLKWHMCPCHEPFMAQSSIYSNYFADTIFCHILSYINHSNYKKCKQIILYFQNDNYLINCSENSLNYLCKIY